MRPLRVRFSPLVSNASSGDGSNSLPLRVITPIRDVFHREPTTGMLLIIATLMAVVWANSPVANSYDDLWNAEIALDIAGHTLGMELLHWINGLAMVLIFVAGREMLREITRGELRKPQQASLPFTAAIWPALHCE